MGSMEDCTFCKIVAGSIPASVVYEDDKALALLTIKAINEGHTLVIPKAHIPYVHEMDDITYQHVMMVVKKVSVAVNQAYQPEKVGLMVSGWDIPHTHIHIVPMHDSSDIVSKKSFDNTMLHPSSDELNTQAAKIREIMDKN